MELAIQKFIREHGLEAAVEKWSLRVNEDDTGLVQINYHMINSPNNVQECNECRGLILDSKNNWNSVAFPFYRFFNEHEGPAEQLNLNVAKLQEKVDGSLIILYFHPHKNKWQAATRGSVLASGNVGNNENKTFNDLFNEAWAKYPNAQRYIEDKQHIVFVFELIGPENRVLTLYNECDLRLLTARNMETLCEASEETLNDISENMVIARPKEYEFNTREDIQAILENFNPTDEGFVLTQYALNEGEYNNKRVKIKNPRYLALSHLLGAGDEDLLNSKRLVILIRTGEVDEVLSYFPEYESQITEMKRRLDSLTSKIEEDYKRLQHLKEDKKAFAMEAKKTLWPHALFAFNNGKVESVYEYVINMKEEALLEILQKM